MSTPELMPKIKNKQRRSEIYQQFLKAKKKHKLEEKKKRMEMEKTMGDKAPPKQMPKTLESMRVPDETMVDLTNREVQEDMECDEMSAFFRQETTPKILITTSKKPCKRTDRFCKELRNAIPNSFVRYRRGLALKKIIPQCIERDFTDLIVVNEDRKTPNGILLCHLPDGPTAEFKLMNVKLTKEIKRTGKMSDHYPEVNIHNFGTRLGVTIGRMLTCLFPHKPDYYGRRVVTFHNQRDYIFFRQHRYEFKSAEKVGLQELGPRFILKLRSLQKGTFDSKFGMYEWIHKRHEMDTSRRKFHL